MAVGKGIYLIKELRVFDLPVYQVGEHHILISLLKSLAHPAYLLKGQLLLVRILFLAAKGGAVQKVQAVFADCHGIEDMVAIDNSAFQAPDLVQTLHLRGVGLAQGTGIMRISLFKG